MILVISNKDDLTTDFIIHKLSSAQIPFYRLNTEDLFSTVNINFDFGNNKFKIIDTALQKNIDIQNDVKSIYLRRPILPNLEQFNISKNEKSFIEKEIYYVLEGLYSVLRNKFWISNPNRIRQAENKILQLQIAKELGFNVPHTLLTNIKKDTLNFIDSNSAVIKPIKSGLVAENKESLDLIYTRKINKEMVLANSSQFPLYIQEEIKNKTDIRVTVVGDKVFAAEIDYHNSDIIDWRAVENNQIKYKTTILPNKVSELCVQLLKRLKLEFGAIDLAKNQNNSYYFFEINPNGQWAWLDKELDINIAQEIVNVLINGGLND